MGNTQRLAVVAVVLAAVFGGLGPIFGKLALRQFTPYSIVSLRFFLALLVLFPVLIRMGKQKIQKEDYLLFLFVSLLWAGNVFGFIIGLQYTTAIMSQVMYLLVPVIVLSMSKLVFRERFLSAQIVGVILGILGGGLILVKSFFSKPSDILLSLGTFKGNVIVLLAVVCWSLYLVFSKRLSKGYSSLALTAYSGLVTLMISIPFFVGDVVSGDFPAAPVGVDGIVGILGSAFVLSVAMLFLYQWGIKHSTAFTAASVGYLSPLTATLVAIPLFGERLTLSLLLSAGLIFVGVYLATVYPIFRSNASGRLGN